MVATTGLAIILCWYCVKSVIVEPNKELIKPQVSAPKGMLPGGVNLL